MSGNQYFPTQPHEVLEALQRLYQMHYDLSEKVGNQKPVSSPKLDAAKPEQGSPSRTTINGIYVQPIPPKNGQVLKYNSATNQLEWS